MGSSAYSSDVVGLASMRLSQSRYKKGQLYVSIVLKAAKIVAYDVRFFVEDGGCLYPTRSGFRVPVDRMEEFRRVLGIGDHEKIVRVPIADMEGRALLVNYCNDKYGEGMDVRYYVETKRYTGWDKRGVRFVLDDWRALGQIIAGIGEGMLNSGETNLFKGRPIKKFERSRSGTRTTGGAKNRSEQDTTERVHDDILRLLDSI